ncbi:hypothetical protein EIKCOROL_00869 [Eikenella corrodens ATCC 23834]|uniref:Uncharacterized protein n=1 Tax=Eikenella corrodens ATCC 23834 TaxID=546274 RepID=C0DU38_EIKCO|nr:hypothetical protein EIKCOROL_00869 [Eikenella corrodens ATCC 23834]
MLFDGILWFSGSLFCYLTGYLRTGVELCSCCSIWDCSFV